MNAQFPAPADAAPAPQRPVVLIGPMAAGKSFLALHMSKFYGYDFVDADQLIVSRHGVISTIFREHGEKYFRDLEADTVAEVLRDPDHANAIFSVGGGAPMTPSVRQMLRAELVAYLEVDAETVLPRISGSRTRPMLQPDPERRWQELYESRRACYEELADIRLDGTRNRPVAEIGADLEEALVRLRAQRTGRGAPATDRPATDRPATDRPATDQEAQA
ncbi:shikimate kinase [Kocuria sediminis]|uniref:Shikimate kinase n=1 Tax=Kocuria sediminis TaxID=1038857 RepID=A0A6N8GHY6_9MICC|nr:shikimate kinase [Kocuria sediminis]